MIAATDSITDWIGVGLVFIGMIGAFAGVLWRFSKVVDKNTFVIFQLDQTIKAQWNRLDEHGDLLDIYGQRIVKVETRLDYHEKQGGE